MEKENEVSINPFQVSFPNGVTSGDIGTNLGITPARQTELVRHIQNNSAENRVNERPINFSRDLRVVTKISQSKEETLFMTIVTLQSHVMAIVGLNLLKKGQVKAVEIQMGLSNNDFHF